MKQEFDRIRVKKAMGSAKWDSVGVLYGDEEVLPMWVADMDFRAPEAVIKAVEKRARYGIYGYCWRPDSYFEAVIGWFQKRHGWRIERNWIAYSPGVVTGISVAILALSQPGDKVIVQPPVYYPFFRIVRDNGRQLVFNPLKLENGRYEMDIDGLKKLADSRTRLMILCSPHNPVGRVWSREDLLRVAEFSLENDIILISDEIHSDLVFGGSRHTPMASLSEEIARITVTCHAPSKTFNLAGLKTSHLIIPNQRIRRKYNNMVNNLGLGMDNIFGMVAMEAAYRHGEPWLEELLGYLEENVKFTQRFFRQRIPCIEVIEPEATYLLWLDCRKLGLQNDKLRELMSQKAKVGLNDGPVFGPGGEGFQRLNVACPRSTLEEGLRRIERAVNSL